MKVESVNGVMDLRNRVLTVNHIYAFVIFFTLCANDAILAINCDSGCQCSADGRNVTCVNSVFAKIPRDLSEYTEVLQISKTKLQVLEGLDPYVNLKQMDVSHNRISVIANDAFNNNVVLWRINMQHNRLTTFNVALWSSLLQLRRLNLGGNVISRIEMNSSLAGWPVNSELEQLFLQDNKLTTIRPGFLSGLSKLKILDLHGNNIFSISESALSGVESLESIDLSHNFLQTLNTGVFKSQINLRKLDLSHNALTSIPVKAFSEMQSLQVLALNDNRLKILDPNIFDNLIALTELNLSGNNLYEIKSWTFQSNIDLRLLDLSHMSNLSVLHDMAFSGLKNLITLNLNNNKKLHFLRIALFEPMENLNLLRLEFNNISSLYEETFRPLKHPLRLSVHHNPFTCNCAIKWIRDLATNGTITIEQPENTRCQKPELLNLYNILDVPSDNLTCTKASIISHTEDSSIKIGHHAMLKCEVTGDPTPMIIWKTPRGKLYLHNDYQTGVRNSEVSHFDIRTHQYHQDHYWHNSDYYSYNTSHARIKILSNGNLFIDYILRSDAGKYTCTAKNPAGNVSVDINIVLNYLIIKDVTVASMVVGFSSAGVFFGLGILIGLFRFIRRKCSESEQKRQRMCNILDTLDQYKSLRFDKLDKMRDNYGNQVSKIKDNCITQMDKMRENYFSQIAKIRDNCSQQMDKLRENYNNQMSKIKDYSTHQIDKIRENYNFQMIKIRDYGSNQLEKLRDTYKLQHQHLIKILETMNMDACRGIMDTDNITNDPMFIDTNFTLDVGLGSKCVSHDSVSDSEFLTACSDSDGISIDLVGEEEVISQGQDDTPMNAQSSPNRSPSSDESSSINLALLFDENDATTVDVDKLETSSLMNRRRDKTSTDNIAQYDSTSESEDDLPRVHNDTDSSDGGCVPITSTTSPQIHIAPRNGSPKRDENGLNIQTLDV